MAKYIVIIRRVEYYEDAVVVDAKSEVEAVERVEREWEESDYLYEQVTDMQYDSDTQFHCEGKASKEDIKKHTNI